MIRIHTEPKDAARLAVGSVAVEILTALKSARQDFGRKIHNNYLNLGHEHHQRDALDTASAELTQPPSRGIKCVHLLLDPS